MQPVIRPPDWDEHSRIRTEETSASGGKAFLLLVAIVVVVLGLLWVGDTYFGVDATNPATTQPAETPTSLPSETVPPIAP